MRIEPPDPPLSDGTIALRPWTLDDVPAVAAACQDAVIAEWLSVPVPYTEDDARAFLTSMTRPELEDTVALAITDADGTVLGSMTMWIVRPGVAEFGYWIAPDARGRGHTPRALRLFAQWALGRFELRRLQLGTFPGNRASERVAEKLGFTREGVFRAFAEQRGEVRDLTMWSLLPGELR
jgi:ribosomal-protein-alanine N-acetyltransferase